MMKIFGIMSALFLGFPFFTSTMIRSMSVTQKLLTQHDQDHSHLFDIALKTDTPIDALLEGFEKHEDKMSKSLRYIALEGDEQDELKEKYFQTQKALLGLKLIKLHEDRKKCLIYYGFWKIFNIVGGAFSWILAGEIHSRSQSYPKCAALGLLGSGFFAGAYYCSAQRAKVKSLVTVSRDAVYEFEEKADGSNRVEAGMNVITLAPDNELAVLINAQKPIKRSFIFMRPRDRRYALKEHLKSLKAIIKTASQTRNIDAVIVASDMLAVARKIKK